MKNLSESAWVRRDGITVEIRRRKVGYLVTLWMGAKRVTRSGRECEIQLEPAEIHELILAILAIDPLFTIKAVAQSEAGDWTADDGLSQMFRREYSSFAVLTPTVGSRVREHADGSVSWAPTVAEIYQMGQHAGETIGYAAS